MQQPPVPEPRDLLPPLLACLPTSFTASSQPPPSLLPLLAPTLRQRVSYLSPGSADSWVKLLGWNAQQAAKLPSLVEHLELEPHPVSGELELDDVRAVKYRRLDDETLQARLEVEQFNLLPIYVWCEDDEHGQTGPGWKLTELKSLDDIDNDDNSAAWHDLALQANKAYEEHADAQRSMSLSAARRESTKTDNGNAEDDYWAAYDMQPAETPGPEPKPSRTTAGRAAANDDDDYYARYGSEVQPALDAHDPDEEQAHVASESTLSGIQHVARPVSATAIVAPVPAAAALAIPTIIEHDDRPPWERALYPHKAQVPHDSAVANSLDHSLHSEINMPRPISPASSSRSVERLEEQAAAMSDAASNHSRVELGIKQHISTDIKSLFRLAKTAGMSRRSFELLIKRELDVLSMLDDDDDYGDDINND